MKPLFGIESLVAMDRERRITRLTSLSYFLGMISAVCLLLLTIWAPHLVFAVAVATVVDLLFLIACCYLASPLVHLQHFQIVDELVFLFDGSLCENEQNRPGSPIYCLALRSFTEDDCTVKTRAVCFSDINEPVPVLDRPITEIDAMSDTVVGHGVDRELCIIYSYWHQMEERRVNLADCTSVGSWSDLLMK